MLEESLIVALGPARYRVQRTWGDLPAGAGAPTDVACAAAVRLQAGS
ncbi:hypothetical protein KO353_06970 [Elioraea tepida]|uniref:Uncharacterized protein n=1 Tax=Elioraea tepida TaxID=2843330 RepID=A0A975YKN1_9PROT|nr:hypothetical protein [Elioraea tepida]QXM25930.1 hypothetical protein KO353_06970 [Elioraea tepida]